MFKTMLISLLMLLLSVSASGDTVRDPEQGTHPIIGGTPIAALGDYPFVVALQVLNVSGGKCTGSLVAPRWILTAAHCVEDGNGIAPVEDITVFGAKQGALWTGNKESGPGRVVSVVVHPEHNYFAATGGVDLALIELSDPLSEGGFAEKGFDVEPVEVTDNTKEAVAYLFKHNATVIGLPPGLSPADVLLNGLSLEKIEVPWWTPPECRSRWNVSSEAIHDRMLCAGGSENKRIAEGDSGGPLLINTTDGWRQIGVSVAAMDLGSGSVISAHVRLSSVRNWIYSYTGEEETVVPTKPPIILTHTFAGPLANATAETEITITNRTGDPCKASIRFHRGTEEAAAVRLNGEYLDGNRVETSIEGGAVRRVLLTADPGQDLAVGAVYIEQDSGCAAGALQVEGRYLITSQDGQIVEAFSVLPQSESDWMGDGECRTLQNAFGGQDDMGLAMVTAQPGEAAPPGAQLTFEAYNWQGEFVGAPPALEVTGEHQALNPWEFSEARLVKLCLDAAGDPAFRLSVIAIAAKTSSRSVQYSNGVLMRP